MDGRRWVGLLRACHPEPTIAVTAVVSAFALAAGRGAGTLWVLAAILAGQLSVGWSNDVVDHRRDVAAGRTDKPVAAGLVPARTVAVAAGLALLAVIPLSFASGWRAAPAHLVGVAAAWSYNLGMKATLLSPLPYAVAFGALPAFVLLGLPDPQWPPWWMVAAGALLGLGAHFANVVPDIEDDIQQHVVGLPHRIGARASVVTAGVLLLAASVVLAVGPGADPLGVAAIVVTAGLLAGAALAGRQPASRWMFRAAMVIAVVDVALLIARGNTIAG
ncbi:MAG TPA: UbiA family prenyltransferase [Kribbellaceae bacterium]|nr:UbiA family prenyltransferase [Kribbellaceae bacterium]